MKVQLRHSHHNNVALRVELLSVAENDWGRLCEQGFQIYYHWEPSGAVVLSATSEWRLSPLIVWRCFSRDVSRELVSMLRNAAAKWDRREEQSV